MLRSGGTPAQSGLQGAGVPIHTPRMNIKSTETHQAHHRLGSRARCFIRNLAHAQDGNRDEFPRSDPTLKVMYTMRKGEKVPPISKA